MSFAKALKHKLPKGTKLGNKYGAKAADGYPSGLERKVGQMLYLRERAKEISNVQRQVSVSLTVARIKSKIDFSYDRIVSGAGIDIKVETVFVEAKGVETDRWRIIKQLWRYFGPGQLELWVAGRYGEPYLKEIIKP